MPSSARAATRGCRCSRGWAMLRRPRRAPAGPSRPAFLPMPHRADQDPLAFRVFNEIGIIEQLSRTMFERVMPDGLTVPQFSVLNHFVRLGGERSPAQLAS